MESEETRLEGWTGWPNTATMYAHALLVRTETLTQTAIATSHNSGAAALRDMFVDWLAALQRGERYQDLDLNDYEEGLLVQYLGANMALIDWDELADFFCRFAD